MAFKMNDAPKSDCGKVESDNNVLFSVQRSGLKERKPYVFIDKKGAYGYIGYSPLKGELYHGSIFRLTTLDDSTFSGILKDSGTRYLCSLKLRGGEWKFSYSTNKITLKDKGLDSSLQVVQKKIFSSGVFETMSYYLDVDPYESYMKTPLYSEPIYRRSVDSLIDGFFNLTASQAGNLRGCTPRYESDARKYFASDGINVLSFTEDEAKVLKALFYDCVMLKNAKVIDSDYQLLRTTQSGYDSVAYNVSADIIEVDGHCFKCKEDIELLLRTKTRKQ